MITKGAWRAKNNGYRFDILDDAGRNVLASSRGMEELEANAQLIAAAPDLYEALKELSERLRTHGIVEVKAFQALAKVKT